MTGPPRLYETGADGGWSQGETEGPSRQASITYRVTACPGWQILQFFGGLFARGRARDTITRSDLSWPGPPLAGINSASAYFPGRTMASGMLQDMAPTLRPPFNWRPLLLVASAVASSAKVCALRNGTTANVGLENMVRMLGERWPQQRHTIQYRLVLTRYVLPSSSSRGPGQYV